MEQKKITEEEKQGEKKIKTLPFSQLLKIFGLESFLFSITLILGIFSAQKIVELLGPTQKSLPELSLLDFLIYFVIITVFVVLLSFLKKFQKTKGVIYKGIFILAIFGGGTMVLSVWTGDILALVVIGVLIYFYFKKQQIYLHNLIVILGLAGAGSVLGLQLTSKMIIVLLIVLSIYDFIAVYKTKHMIKMAKEMVQKGVVLGLIVPLEFLDFKESVKKIKPGGKFLILGGGDIAFPLLLAVSLVQSGIWDSLIVGLFSLIGLFVSFFIFCVQKTRSPIPALPPIALFSVIGYLIVVLI